MKFTKAFKGATGGNPYPQDFKTGDDCPDDLLDAAEAAGALAEDTPIDPKDVVIPDDWSGLNAKDMIKLAKALGGEGIKTKADAEAHIQLTLEERNPVVPLEVVEKEDKWVIVKGTEQVGEPYDTKEAADAALADLASE